VSYRIRFHPLVARDLDAIALWILDYAGQEVAARKLVEIEAAIATALLHKSGERRTSPFPGRTHPTASVAGMPSAVKPFSTATRIWNSAT
jgi:plasmid stabilization system protein ParE